MDSPHLTPDELTAYLNVPPRWVEKNTHRLPGRTKVGRYVRFRLVDIERQLLTGSVLLPMPETSGRFTGRRPFGKP